MALKSLTRGLDLPGEAPAKAPEKKDRPTAKIALLGACILLTGVAVAYNFGAFDKKEPAPKSASGDPGTAKTRDELMAEQHRGPK
jgi:hypothetical protein